MSADIARPHIHLRGRGPLLQNPPTVGAGHAREHRRTSHHLRGRGPLLQSTTHRRSGPCPRTLQDFTSPSRARPAPTKHHPPSGRAMPANTAGLHITFAGAARSYKAPPTVGAGHAREHCRTSHHLRGRGPLLQNPPTVGAGHAREHCRTSHYLRGRGPLLQSTIRRRSGPCPRKTP